MDFFPLFCFFLFSFLPSPFSFCPFVFGQRLLVCLSAYLVSLLSLFFLFCLNPIRITPTYSSGYGFVVINAAVFVNFSSEGAIWYAMLSDQDYFSAFLSSYASVCLRCRMLTRFTSAIFAASCPSPIYATTLSSARAVVTRPRSQKCECLTLANSCSKNSCQ